MTHSDVDGGLAFAVLRKQSRVPRQQKPEAVLVAVLRAEVRRGVPIDVLHVGVGASHKQALHNREIAPDAGYVQGRPEVLGARVNHGPVLNEDFDQARMALAG